MTQWVIPELSIVRPRPGETQVGTAFCTSVKIFFSVT